MRLSLALGTCLLLCTTSAFADDHKSPLTVKPITEQLNVIYGQGGNIAVSHGKDGLYIIDDQFARLSNDIKKALGDIKTNKAEFVVSTHHHGDHTGGNESFAEDGSHIIAHNNVHKRLEAQHGKGSKFLPVISFGDDLTLHFNGENAKLKHYPHAHTDGDAIVHFTKANVIHMGDIYFNLGALPFIDVDSGGSVDGIINAVTDVLTYINDQTIVIPGHGKVTDTKALIKYLALMKKAKSAMVLAMEGNKSQEEVIAMKPLDVLNLQYSNWLSQERTTTLFYRSLKAKHHH